MIDTSIIRNDRQNNKIIVFNFMATLIIRIRVLWEYIITAVENAWKQGFIPSYQAPLLY